MPRHSSSPHPRPPLFQRFFQTEAARGGLLLLSACVALIVANTPWADAYDTLWSIPIGITVMHHSVSLTFHEWINDGLMAVFFVLVGLEIKREFIAGELSSPRKAALPLAGALGGMILPARHLSTRQSHGYRSARVGYPHGDGHRLRARCVDLDRPDYSAGCQGISHGPCHR